MFTLKVNKKNKLAIKKTTTAIYFKYLVSLKSKLDDR